MQTNTLIQFNNVTLAYGRRTVLTGLNFSIFDGEFFAIIGANGSGKTTILRALLGILKPRRGAVEFRDGQRLRFGYVPQRGMLDEIFPLTALEIVLMGCYGRMGVLRRPTKADRTLADHNLDRVGIPELAGKRFADLSGGQKQRVLIARALMADAQAMVLDEPTDGMDLEGQHAILDLIEKLRSESGVTVIYVTHRLNELANSAQRMLLLHEGAVRIGPTSEILRTEVLHEVYGVNVRVALVDEKLVIV
jgi:manganese/zinc/iron transport system ATP- binding protein